MKGEIVKVNGKYVARIKRWYNIRWRYIGINYTHSCKYAGMFFVTCDTYNEAQSKLKRYIPYIVKLKENDKEETSKKN